MTLFSSSPFHGSHFFPVAPFASRIGGIEAENLDLPVIELPEPAANDAEQAIFRPRENTVVGNWRTHEDGIDLSSAINETTPDDETYIHSEYTPTESYCKIRFPRYAAEVISDFTLRYRLDRFGINPLNITVRLLSGEDLIDEWEHLNVVPGFEPFERIIAQEDIADVSELYIEFEATEV